jgi:signal transduction histidine kinase/CheY-like chemotaxis protein
MTASSFVVPVHVVDAAPGADNRWQAVLANAVTAPLDVSGFLPSDLGSETGGVWVLVVDEWCSPEVLDRTLAIALAPESRHRFVVLIEDPDGMPAVEGTVWLPLDCGDAEVRRWVDWLSRCVLDARALRLVLQCPVDSVNPVVGFDREGTLTYANPVAQGLLESELEGELTVAETLEAHSRLAWADSGSSQLCMFELGDETYAFRFVSDLSVGVVHGHGFEVSELVRSDQSQQDVETQSDNKSAFLRSMSHELRTPLNAVLGCTEAMREGVYGQLEPDQLEAVQAIRTSGKHLLKLINDILDVSKIEAGCMQLDAYPVGVQTLCQSVIQIVQGTAQSKDITLELDIDPFSQVLHADPLRVRQILINLLGNAVKFTPAGGEVGLDVCRDRARDCLVFRVWDTGPGISSDYASTIFEPFVQVQDAQGPGQIGSGLGLSLARQLAQLHGGDVVIESFDGPGTILELHLPIGEVGDVPEEDPLATSEWFMQAPIRLAEPQVETVLIAEDTDSNFQHISDLLVSLGYRVERAHNGQEAVGQCRALKPDIVLMDIDMPVMNGLDAIRILREDAQTQSVPIIAVTAMANIVDARACMSAGASAFLPKPFALRALMNTMSSLVA